MLMEYVDITNSGTYDFLYLRIDFQNRCKLIPPSPSPAGKIDGRAVWDMLLSTSLIPLRSSPLPNLASEQNGPPPFRWGTKIDSRNRFHSDKICDISYANIQGKESLIEKFRNSCVMDEDPTYRPKIFHSSGSLKGQEQEFPPPTNPLPLPPPKPPDQGWCLTGRFPEPNNTRRKMRSIACARQIGFPPFPPRAGFTLGLFPPVAMRKTDTI